MRNSQDPFVKKILAKGASFSTRNHQDFIKVQEEVTQGKGVSIFPKDYALANGLESGRETIYYGTAQYVMPLDFPWPEDMARLSGWIVASGLGDQVKNRYQKIEQDTIEKKKPIILTPSHFLTPIIVCAAGLGLSILTLLVEISHTCHLRRRVTSKIQAWCISQFY